MIFIYDKPKHKIKQVLTSKEEDEHVIRDEQEQIVHVLMTQSNPDTTKSDELTTGEAEAAAATATAAAAATATPAAQPQPKLM